MKKKDILSIGIWVQVKATPSRYRVLRYKQWNRDTHWSNKNVGNINITRRRR